MPNDFRWDWMNVHLFFAKAEQVEVSPIKGSSDVVIDVKGGPRNFTLFTDEETLGKIEQAIRVYWYEKVKAERSTEAVESDEDVIDQGG